MSRRSLTPEDPQRLGEYWLAARLGSGGQGVVYEAYDAAGARVAVKVLHRDMASGAAARGRFAREVTAAQRVASFCTARVLAAAPDADTPYIVSEFVPGPDLRAAVHTSGPVRGDDLLRLATGVATALAAIHQAGVVHRDLKPGNVLLGPDGPRVIDFGIARTAEMTLTETGAVMGTFGYIAPEALQGRRADAAADVFAWGAVVLFAATGREPFRGENVSEVVVRALEHEPDLAVLPELLRPLVGEALAKRPEDRPSAAALLLRLLGGTHDDQQALRAGASAAARVPAHGTAVAPAVPALGDAAEVAHESLPPAVQIVAREVWLRLVAPGSAPDGSHDSVCTAGEEELLSGRPGGQQAAVREAIAAFRNAGVLMHEAATVRPASAAVLRAWPRLREWVDTDREGLRIHRRLGEAARAWHRHGRRPDDLERGTALRIALDWAATAPTRLRPNLLERQFLTASRTADIRRVRRRRVLLSSTVVLTVLALVAGVLAWQQNRANEQQRLLAEARRLASVADSLRFADPVTAMRLSVAAYRIADITETRSALIGAMTQKEAESFSAPTEGWPYFSSDGRTLLTVEKNQVVRWDVASQRRVDETAIPELHPGVVAAVSDDARTIAVNSGGEEGKDGGIQVWDVDQRQRIGKPIDWPWTVVQFGPSGRTLVLEDVERGTIRLWDIRRQRVLFESSYVSSHAAAVSPNDRIMALCSRYGSSLELWDVTNGAPLSTPVNMGDCPSYASGEDGPIKFSRDSRTVTLVVDGESVRVWDIASGKERKFRHAGVYASAVSKDGNFIATAGGDEIMLWRLSAPSRPVFRYPPVSEVPSRVRIDLSARKIRYLTGLSASDSVVSVRSLDLGQAIAPGWRTKVVQAATFSPDGRFLGVAWNDQRTGRFQLRDVHSGNVTADLPGVRIPLNDGEKEEGGQSLYSRLMSFSPDGRTFAYAVGNENRAIVWDVTKDKLRATLYPPIRDESPLNGVALNSDGESLMISRLGEGSTGGIEVWDVRRRVKLRNLRDTGGNGTWVQSFALRPDKRLLVISNGVINLPSERVLRKDLSQEEASAIAFSPDGRRLAIGEESGRVTMWDGDARHRLGVLSGTFVGPRLGYPESVSALAFSADGHTLAVGGRDGTVQLWDVDSQQLLGSALSTPSDKILSLAFGKDDTLYAAGSRILHQRYVLNPRRVAEAVCKRADGGPSRGEWHTYVREMPYRKVC
ncbi:serine/threonine-protein kinase [Streptomyces sp. NPDC002668]|uniref:serine/threonine-protein kinase n=1 Tax=Streptomyces sp. NPDC002668 TaxID=3154422 RepID=UPI003319D92C